MNISQHFSTNTANLCYNWSRKPPPAATTTKRNTTTLTEATPALKKPEHIFEIVDEPLPQEPRVSIYDPEKLNYTHKAILRAAFNGHSAEEISNLVNVTSQNVRKIIESEVGQRILNEMEVAASIDEIDVREKLEQLSKKAILALEEVLDAGSERGRLVASNSVLDRAGFGVIKQSQNVNLTGKISDDALAIINKRAEQAGLLPSREAAGEATQQTEPTANKAETGGGEEEG